MASELEVGKVKVGTEGFTPHASVDDLTIAPSDAAAGLTIRAGSNSGTSRIAFADLASTTVGLITYDHNTDNLTLAADDDVVLSSGAGTGSFTLDSTGAVSIPSAAGTQVALTVKGGNNIVDNTALSITNQAGDTGTRISNNGQLFASTLATFSGGIKSEKGIYGGTLSVADDAVGEITPPRQATFMTLSYNATSAYPSHWGALLYLDVGLSLVSIVVAGPSSAVVAVQSDVSGTTGTDGKTNVGGTVAADASSIGKIRIENRHGTSVTYNYNFFG